MIDGSFDHARTYGADRAALWEPVCAGRDVGRRTSVGVKSRAERAGLNTAYAYELVSSIGEINAADWNAVCNLSESPYMDLRFIRAVENSIGPPVKYWHALFYDESRRPVGCACFSLFVADGAVTAPPAIQKAIAAGRKLFKPLFHFRTVICGLPVTTGETQLAAVPDADMQRLAAGIDEIACKLARQERANFITVKEFDEEGVGRYASLEQFGYRRADGVLTYTLKNEFKSFDEYYNSRSKRTRANMRKYMKRFEDAGLRYVHMRGGEGADKVYTDEVHELYMAVYRRAAVKFEILPAEFFRELARQLPDDSYFTFIYLEERVVGFCVGVQCPAMHYMLLCGIDYQVNADSDLYFNMIYRGMEFGMVGESPLIRVGASADEFKRRLGTFSKKLYFYVKMPNPAIAWVVNRIFNVVFPSNPAFLENVPDAEPVDAAT